MMGNRLQSRPTGGLTTPEVAHVAGVTKRQLDYWVRSGRLVPSIQAPNGSGTFMWWSYADVQRLMLIAERLAWGMTVDAALRDTDPPVPPPVSTLDTAPDVQVLALSGNAL